MRYSSCFWVALLACVGLRPDAAVASTVETRSVQQTSAIASSLVAKETQTSRDRAQSNPFLQEAQVLVWEQWQIIELVEEAIANPDGDRLQIARESLFSHLRKVDRLLRDLHIVPLFICRDGAVLPANISPVEQQVYCSLFYSQQQLEPLIPVLERQTPLLSELELVDLQPVSQLTSVSFGVKADNFLASRAIPIPAYPVSEPAIVGQPTKMPEMNWEFPQPASRLSLGNSAIAPNSDALYALITSRRLLLGAQNALPKSIPATVRGRESNGEIDYFALFPAEAKLYARVLEQSNTGMALIGNTTASPLDLNPLRDRLQPAANDPIPFVPLTTLARGFIPRLVLRASQGNFVIPAQAIAYGFMVDLGDIPLEGDFPPLEDLEALTSVQQSLFRNYRPPEKLKAVQVDQRRFFFGKMGIDVLPEAIPPAFAYAPARVDRTYLLRLIQYQLPAALLEDEPISRERRRYSDALLETPSSDLLVVFRPVRQNADGSYVILWKILDEFPQPQIADLVEYIDFQ